MTMSEKPFWEGKTGEESPEYTPNPYRKENA